MISIIVCARDKDLSSRLKQNIAETIGVPYETVVIDNSQNQYSIFSAYNQGVALSKNPFLLFMHDDIHYHTQDWGKKLLRHFDDEAVGGVGIAGTHYLSFIPGAWWSNGVGHLHLLQSVPGGTEPELHNFYPSGEAGGGEVLALDGVWFCLRRKVFDQVSFDEKTFRGFHFYDVDTTLQVSRQGYRLLCVKDILIHHLSVGVLNETWVENAFLFHEKWKDRLPASLVRYKKAKQMEMEYRVLNEFTSTQIRSGLSKRKAYRTALRLLVEYRPAHRYFKTPYWLLKLLLQYAKSSLLRH